MKKPIMLSILMMLMWTVSYSQEDSSKYPAYVRPMIAAIIAGDACIEREKKLLSIINEQSLKIVSRDSTILDLKQVHERDQNSLFLKDQITLTDNIKHVNDANTIQSLTKDNKKLSSRVKWANIQVDGLLIVVTGLLVKIFLFK